MLTFNAMGEFQKQLLVTLCANWVRPVHVLFFKLLVFVYELTGILLCNAQNNRPLSKL